MPEPADVEEEIRLPATRQHAATGKHARDPSPEPVPRRRARASAATETASGSEAPRKGKEMLEQVFGPPSPTRSQTSEAGDSDDDSMVLAAVIKRLTLKSTAPVLTGVDTRTQEEHEYYQREAEYERVHTPFAELLPSLRCH